jgi:large subunit ribosomal protein L30
MAKAKSSAAAAQKIKVTLIKSTAGHLKSHQATVRGLGLRRIRDTAVLSATPEIQGMLRSAGHLLKVEQA